MSIIVNTNFGAALTSKHLEKNQRSMDGIVERLSAGKRTIKAADDAKITMVFTDTRHFKH